MFNQEKCVALIAKNCALLFPDYRVTSLNQKTTKWRQGSMFLDFVQLKIPKKLPKTLLMEEFEN